MASHRDRQNTPSQAARRSGVVDASGTPWPVVMAAGAGMAAAWVAAGSTGLLVAPLRHAIEGVLLAAAVVALRPSWRRLAVVGIVVAVGVILSVLAEGLPAVDALVVAAVLAALVFRSAGVERRVLVIVATAAAALAVLRIACFTVPTVETIYSAVGFGLGRLAAFLGGRSLWLGGSLGGVDLLVLMGVFSAGWLRATPPPRRARGIAATTAILLVHAVYLVGLSYATDLAGVLPPMPVPETLDPGDYRPTDWSVAAELRFGLPWNVPLVAAALQAAVAMAMLRWTRIEVEDGSEPPETSPSAHGRTPATPSQSDEPQETDAERTRRWRSTGALLTIAVVVAVGTGMVAAWTPGVGDLSGKTVVACRGDDVDWAAPVHESLAMEQGGTFGLLPAMVSSLGGKWLLSNELSDADLKSASLLVVVRPSRPWPEDRLKRIEEYVRGGGSLLVITGPMTSLELRQGGQDSSNKAADEATATSDVRPVNQLLNFTGMKARHDVVLSVSDFWDGSMGGSTHPAVLGLSDRVLGVCRRETCSIAARWPARPILTARWGWSEPGSDMLYTGYAAAGEQWGDLVLAAERPIGAGTVVAVGDSWWLTNVGLAEGHEMASRLLGYLAGRPSNPQNLWRQALAIVGYLLLAALVLWRTRPARLVAIALVLAGVLTGAMAHARTAGPVPSKGQPIAYLDTSHLELGGQGTWAADSTEGFLLTLARNGYLPLKMHRWSPERLNSASLLVVMGPARVFSAGELAQIQAFVDQGGHFIAMIGATEAAAARALLERFEFEVGISPSPTSAGRNEAEPMGRYSEGAEEYGRMSVPYLDASKYGRGNYVAAVWFFTAWPVGSQADDAEPLVFDGDGRPLVVNRRIGKGRAVLIGDSRFAFNVNQGYDEGRVVEAVCQNAQFFWRWFLSRLGGGAEWIPPDRTRRARQGAFRQPGEVMR